MNQDEYSLLVKIKSEYKNNFIPPKEELCKNKFKINLKDETTSLRFMRRSSSFNIQSIQSPNNDNQVNNFLDQNNSNSYIQSMLLSYNAVFEKLTKTKNIVKQLILAQNTNSQLKQNLKELSNQLNLKHELVSDNISRVKKLLKPRQKKHIRYTQFLPLSKIYNFSIKRIHKYFQLLEMVTNSNYTLKTSDTRINTAFNTNKQLNRFDFKPIEDKYLQRDFKDIDFKELASSQLRRTILELFVRKLELTGFYQYKKWTPSEDLILKRAILYYGPKNWQQISYCLEGRNNSQCFHRWMKGINPKIKRLKWSFEEDLTLVIALKIYGDHKWSKISHHIDSRTDIQCRERYCNILDPKLSEVRWSSEEDVKLTYLYSKYGNKWSLIAKIFGDRTDNTCWRRFKFLKYISSDGKDPDKDYTVNSYSKYSKYSKGSFIASGYSSEPELEKNYDEIDEPDELDLFEEMDKIEEIEDEDDEEIQHIKPGKKSSKAKPKQIKKSKQTSKKNKAIKQDNSTEFSTKKQGMNFSGLKVIFFISKESSKSKEKKEQTVLTKKKKKEKEILLIDKSKVLISSKTKTKMLSKKRLNK